MMLSILKFLFNKTMFRYRMEEYGKGFEMGWEFATGERFPNGGNCGDILDELRTAINNAATEGKQS